MCGLFCSGLFNIIKEYTNPNGCTKDMINSSNLLAKFSILTEGFRVGFMKFRPNFLPSIKSNSKWNKIKSKEDLPARDGLFEYCVNGVNCSGAGIHLVNAKALEKLFDNNKGEKSKITHYKRFKF